MQKRHTIKVATVSDCREILSWQTFYVYTHKNGFNLQVTKTEFSYIMKIGLAQINTTVGDLAGNQQLIATAYTALLEQGADLVVFPELTLCGYPPRDLLFKTRFVADMQARLEALAQACGSVPALIGFAEARAANSPGRPYYNSIAWCENGQIQSIARKMLLPNYDVFDEARYFEAASEVSIKTWKGLQIGLTVCEDIWAVDPSQAGEPLCTRPARNSGTIEDGSAD